MNKDKILLILLHGMGFLEQLMVFNHSRNYCSLNYSFITIISQTLSSADSIKHAPSIPNL